MDAVVHEMGDAMGEYPRLARAGTGDHQQRTGLVSDRVELVGVQAFGERRRAAVDQRIRRRTIGGVGDVLGEEFVVSHVGDHSREGVPRPQSDRPAAWPHQRCFTGWMEYTEVTAEEFHQLDGLDDWRYVLDAIHATFRSPTYLAAAELTTTIAEIAEAAQHHPDIDVRYPGRVHVMLTTHATGGLTTLDVEVARAISAAAASAGAESQATLSQTVEIAIDTTDADRIRPFWAAVLGYRELHGSLVDPTGWGPPVWFQDMDEPRTERSRFHIDVSVPHDVAEERVAAAIAAGGSLVSDANARSWWVLADADGNEACVCTWQDR